jgi:hypothetical protein
MRSRFIGYGSESGFRAANIAIAHNDLFRGRSFLINWIYGDLLFGKGSITDVCAKGHQAE